MTEEEKKILALCAIIDGIADQFAVVTESDISTGDLHQFAGRFEQLGNQILQGHKLRSELVPAKDIDRIIEAAREVC